MGRFDRAGGRSGRPRPRISVAALMCSVICGLALMVPSEVLAQNNGGNNGNVGNQTGGILIDATGVVSVGVSQDPSTRLKEARQRALAEASLPAELHSPSDSRKISLRRLEAECEKLRDQGVSLAAGVVPDEIFYCAGLTRIDAVYLDPEHQDVVIAGPAEPFAPDALGRRLGVKSRRPVLRLDHGVTVFRTVMSGSEVGCSIDPEPQRLAALNQFLGANSSPASLDVAERRFREMARVLGKQSVRIIGVPADSPVAATLLEADYRMKRISLGLEQPGVKGLKSHLAMLKAGGSSLQRWWFVPYYSALYQSEDGLAYELAGQRAQLLGQDEIANQAGQRSDAATTKQSTQAFAVQFTKKFPQLCENSVVFAELQNIIDWSVVAAIAQSAGTVRAGWSANIWADASWPAYRANAVPKEVQSVVNYRSSGTTLVGLVGGGVTINAGETLRQQTAGVADPEAMRERRSEAIVGSTETKHWWWD